MSLYEYSGYEEAKQLRDQVWVSWGMPELVVQNTECIQAKDGRRAMFIPKSRTATRGLDKDVDKDVVLSR